MTSKHDDQLLQNLYRQQVQQTHVPEQLKASLLAQNKQQHKGWHWQKIIAILTLSGGISFSIFALITHFYQPATTNITTTITAKRTIPVSLKQEQTKPESLVITVEPLPEPPNVTLPPKPASAIPPPNQSVTANSADISGVTLDQNYNGSTQIALTQPQLLTHKVMPEYPKKALVDGLSATVVLSYRINNDGEVEQIKVLSDSPRILNKAAISALSKWQFSPKTEATRSLTQNQQVEFIFKLPQ